MSNLGKVIRAVLCFIAEAWLCVCFVIIVRHINLENPVLETFMYIGFALAIGSLYAPIINEIFSISKK